MANRVFELSELCVTQVDSHTSCNIFRVCNALVSRRVKCQTPSLESQQFILERHSADLHSALLFFYASTYLAVPSLSTPSLKLNRTNKQTGDQRTVSLTVTIPLSIYTNTPCAHIAGSTYATHRASFHPSIMSRALLDPPRTHIPYP